MREVRENIGRPAAMTILVRVSLCNLKLVAKVSGPLSLYFGIDPCEGWGRIEECADFMPECAHLEAVLILVQD
jgi:hypothetical protein